MGSVADFHKMENASKNKTKQEKKVQASVNNAKAANNVVKTAKSAVGKVSYSFGANDVANGKGDCSSFTQYVFQKQGINIGRDTRTQYSKGTSVSKNDLQPGDLIFFQNTYRPGVSHVGIYVGNGKFVHNSSSAGGVTTSDLSNSYYSSHYLGAKRITGYQMITKDDGTKAYYDSSGNDVTEAVLSGEYTESSNDVSYGEYGGLFGSVKEIIFNILVAVFVCALFCIGVLFLMRSFDIKLKLPGVPGL